MRWPQAGVHPSRVLSRKVKGKERLWPDQNLQSSIFSATSPVWMLERWRHTAVLAGRAIFFSLKLRNIWCHFGLTSTGRCNLEMRTTWKSWRIALWRFHCICVFSWNGAHKCSANYINTPWCSLLFLACHSSADVSITLHNQGKDAYKPELYGSSIIVDLRLTHDGVRTYKLKSQSGKLESTLKHSVNTRGSVRCDTLAALDLRDRLDASVSAAV